MEAEKSAKLEKVKQRKLHLLRLRALKNKVSQLERKQESLSSLLRQARADLVVKLEACDNLKRFKGGYQWNNTRAQIRGIKKLINRLLERKFSSGVALTRAKLKILQIEYHPTPVQIEIWKQNKWHLDATKYWDLK